MLNEIRKENEIVNSSDVQETLVRKAERRGFTESFGSFETRYAMIQPVWEVSKFDEETKEILYNLHFECSIRFMGTLSVDDMNQAADDMKAAAMIVETMNNRLEGVEIIRK